MKILNPIQIKKVLFKNRIVMAPMVPFGLPLPTDGIMDDELFAHYSQRAPNGMGLMISQSLSVTSKQMLAGGLGVYSDSHLAYLQKLVKSCHSHGTKFFAQLAYPSASYPNDDSISQFSEKEMEEIKDEFINAALVCKEAGCDGIELHGAHGFFLNMVVSPLANKRKDQFGSSFKGRLKLIKNIVDGIKAFADDNFIISYRMGWNNNLALDIQTAQALESIGIDLLHISFGIPSDRNLQIPQNIPFNQTLYTGTQIKKHIQIPLIVVNDIRTLNRGNELLEENLCDFVAYGKPFLADAAFLTKSLTNYDYKPCFGCKTCSWFISGKTCPAQNHLLLHKK